MDFVSSDSETKSEKSTSLEQINGMSTLQKHVSFFDRNKDGVVYPFETYKGLRAIGCNIIVSVVVAIFLNVGFSFQTQQGKFPDLRFPVVIKNIKRAKHGSDSGTYDKEGRFVPAKFEAIFRKHAHTCSTILTSDELNEMVKENREPCDFVGWIVSFLEWRLLYFILKDKNGLLKKDRVRGLFDGSVFEQMEKENSCKDTLFHKVASLFLPDEKEKLF